MTYTSTELQQTRERRGFSLEQLSAKTKIRVRYLQAIERQDLAALPAGPSGRGFVRAYAREVGIDPDELVQRYNAAFAPPPQLTPHPAVPARQTNAAPETATPAQAVYIGALASVVIGAL